MVELFLSMLLAFGGVLQGGTEPRILQRVEPRYPPLAQAARVQTTVQLTVKVRADGSIEDVAIVNGNPLLNDAAVQAVQQWKFSSSPFGGTVRIDLPFVLPTPVTGTVTGRVIDAEGRPISGVRISLRGAGYAGGKRAATLGIVVRIVQTDSDGIYTVPVQLAGEYYVLASYGVPADAPAGSPVETLSPHTYYPGTPDVFAALPVLARLNATTVADIRIPRIETVRVSGRILMIPPAATARATIDFRLFRTGDARYADEFLWGESLRLENRTEVPFDFRVRPGTYTLTATVVGTGPPNWAHSGRLSLDVRNNGAENLSLLLHRNIEFKGRILSDDPATRFETLEVRLLGRGDTISAFTTTEADGSVRLFNLPEGRYNVEVIGLTGNAYVSAIRLGAESIYEEGVLSTTDKPPEDLLISVKTNGGVVEGVVQTALRQPVDGAQVVLVPEGSRRQNPFFYNSVKADASGVFRLGGLPPGEYKIFGFEVAPPNGAMESAEFIAQYEHHGVRVTVREGLVSSNLAVQVIPKS